MINLKVNYYCDESKNYYEKGLCDGGVLLNGKVVKEIIGYYEDEEGDEDFDIIGNIEDVDGDLNIDGLLDEEIYDCWYKFICK
jgi:hypothetical protein